MSQDDVILLIVTAMLPVATILWIVIRRRREARSQTPPPPLLSKPEPDIRRPTTPPVAGERPLDTRISGQGPTPAAKPAAPLPVDEELEAMLKAPRFVPEPVFPKEGYLFPFAGSTLFQALKLAGQRPQAADIQRRFEDGCCLCLGWGAFVAWAFDLEARNEQGQSGRGMFIAQAAFPKDKQPATDGVTVHQQLLLRGVSEILIETEEPPSQFYQICRRKKIGWLVAGLIPPRGGRKPVESPPVIRAEGVNYRLEVAALNGEVEVVRRLLETGVPPDGAGCARIDTPLSAAASNARLEVVHLLLERGANPDGAGGPRPPLCAASASGCGDRIKVIRALLESGANPNCHDQNQMTPLMFAVHNAEAVALLLEHGARSTEQDHWGRTALMHAAMDGRLESLRTLLAAGADARQMDRGGRNALHLAAYRFQTAALQALASSGLFDVNALDHEGLTPLHYAAGVALRERSGVMMRLAPDALTADMKTTEAQHRSLTDMLETEALPVIDVLMAAGAEINLKDRGGNSPLRIAEREELWKIRARLLQGLRGAG